MGRKLAVDQDGKPYPGGDNYKIVQVAAVPTTGGTVVIPTNAIFARIWADGDFKLFNLGRSDQTGDFETVPSGATNAVEVPLGWAAEVNERGNDKVKLRFASVATTVAVTIRFEIVGDIIVEE